MWILKALLIICFIIILCQDTRERMVYWFLYPLIGILAFLNQSYDSNYIIAGANSLLNLSLISIIIFVIYLYSRFFIKKGFIDKTIGIGDLLLFIFLCFTFSSISFIILFSFSLIFSLLLHLYFKNKVSDKTVPLAGYISLFFAVVYLASFFIAPKYFYAY